MHISLVRFGADLSGVDSSVNAMILEKEITNVLKREAGYVNRQLKKPTKTWDHTVDFEFSVGYSSGDSYVQVSTNDMIYYFLDQGTDVRYATMSYDPLYSPKTEPWSLDAKQGDGYLLFVSKRYPRPGIEARHFVDQVIENRQHKFEANIQRAITRAIRKSGLV